MRSPFLLLWFPSLATYEPRAKDHMPQPFLKLALDIRFHAFSVMSDSLRSHRPEPTWLLFHNSFQAWILEGVAISSSGDLPNPGWNQCLLHWQVDALPLSHPGILNLRSSSAWLNISDFCIMILKGKECFLLSVTLLCRPNCTASNYNIELLLDMWVRQWWSIKVKGAWVQHCPGPLNKTSKGERSKSLSSLCYCIWGVLLIATSSTSCLRKPPHV